MSAVESMDGRCEALFQYKNRFYTICENGSGRFLFLQYKIHFYVIDEKGPDRFLTEGRGHFDHSRDFTTQTSPYPLCHLS